MDAHKVKKERTTISMIGLKPTNFIENVDELLAGRYQILKYLARGGFGETFLAKDIYLPGQPSCVVKKLKPQCKNPKTFQIAQRLFAREAETLHKLGSHEQIPRLLANFEQDGEFYLVQEFIDGHTLEKELIQGKPASEAYVLALLRDILEVLSYVHDHHVIHRDIKPANLIRRRKDNKIVLIDFGAVKEVSTLGINGNEKSVMTVAVGSPGYMPSEQQAFKPRLSSDIYAVGTIAIQAVTGINPKMLNLLNPDFDKGEIFNMDVPNCASISPELTEILAKMVLHDCRDRYQCASEALKDLEQLFCQQFPQYGKTLIQGLESEIVPQYIPRADRGALVEKVEEKNETEDSIILNSDIIDRCQQELALHIGPVASFIFNDAIRKYPQINSQQLLEILTSEIPDIPKKALETIEKLINKEKTVTTSLKNEIKIEDNNSFISSELIEVIEEQLINYIGPLASFLVTDIVTSNPQITPEKLVQILAAEIPDSRAAKKFKVNLLSRI